MSVRLAAVVRYKIPKQADCQFYSLPRIVRKRQLPKRVPRALHARRTPRPLRREVLVRFTLNTRHQNIRAYGMVIVGYSVNLIVP